MTPTGNCTVLLFNYILKYQKGDSLVLFYFLLFSLFKTANSTINFAKKEIVIGALMFHFLSSKTFL